MINKVILLGRVGKKETRATKEGMAVTQLSLVTNKKYTTPQGEKKENNTWHFINCFDKLSDVAANYLHVGDLVYIEGSIQNKRTEQGEKAGQIFSSVTVTELKLLPQSRKSDEQERLPLDATSSYVKGKTYSEAEIDKNSDPFDEIPF